MPIFAVTAAGAPTSAPLARLTGAAWEALMPVPHSEREREGSLTCLESVARAVLSVPTIERYFVMAPKAVKETLPHLNVEWVQAGPGGGAQKSSVEHAFSRWARLRCATVPIDPRWALEVDEVDDIHYLRWWVRRFPEL